MNEKEIFALKEVINKSKEKLITAKIDFENNINPRTSKIIF